MAHHHNISAYGRLAERLNRFPQGAPATPLLFEILKMLFSEEEASLVAGLPIKPFSAEAAAAIWKRPVAESRKILDDLSGRAILMDMEQNGEQVYCLPPPMAGFFEFTFMRVRDDIDQKTLAELFHQYINVEEDFMRELFIKGETGLGRVFVQEAALDEASRLEILDYERAAHIVDTSDKIGVSMCYCRHKKMHTGVPCDAPVELCLTFNSAAHTLVKHGHARALDKAEGHAMLEKAIEAGLVQFGENNREGVNFICNCCGCCCEALAAVKRFGITQSMHSNFIIGLDEEKCLACGICVKKCPVNALRNGMETLGNRKEIDTAFQINEDGERLEGKKEKTPPAINEDTCLGCGVCVRSCPSGALKLIARQGRTITPLNTVHRLVLMAAERGTLQNLIFDNRALLSHRLAAGVLGAVLRLPPVARNLAQKQLKSRYLENLILKFDM